MHQFCSHFFFFFFFQICSLLRGGIAERGGVRVGHRIIEINGQSVVAVPHEKIVNLLATSVGEVRFFLFDDVTVWKLQILREINFGGNSRSAKSAILTHFRGDEF